MLGGAALFITASARAETLDEAVSKAVLHHPRVDLARAGEDVAQEELDERLSKYFPEVSINGAGGRIFGNNSTSRGLTVTRGSAYSDYFEGGITARQMIYDGFETSNRVDAAEAKQESARLSILDVQENLALGAAQAYIDVVRTRQALVLLSQHEAKIDDYLARIKTMTDEGAADEAEYQKARDIRVILDGFVADYEGQLRFAEARYLEVTGDLPGDGMEMPAPRTDLIVANADEGVAFAKENNPMLKASQLMSRFSQYEIDAEKAVLWPDLNTELSYLQSDKVEELGGELEDAKALLRLNWRYEVGGAQEARIAQKKYRHHEALARLRDTERQIELAVRQAFAEYEVALAQLDNQEKRHSLNLTLFDTYQSQFEGAVISLLQLMEADNQLFTTALEKSNAKARVVAAQFAILASLGRLQESLQLGIASADAAPMEQAGAGGSDPRESGPADQTLTQIDALRADANEPESSSENKGRLTGFDSQAASD